MCNLYRVYTSQEEVRGLTRAMIDSVGNMEPEIEVWPDRMAPIVRNTPAGRELAMVRWGLPSSSQALFQAATTRADKMRAKGKDVDFNELLKMEPDGGTTNVRNTASKHWKRWFGVENRCVVPITRFAEPDPASKVEGGRTPNAWFAKDEAESLMLFCRPLDPAMGKRPQDQGRLDQSRPVRVSDNGSQRDRGAGPSEGDAGSADRTRRNRNMADSAMG